MMTCTARQNAENRNFPTDPIWQNGHYILRKLGADQVGGIFHPDISDPISVPLFLLPISTRIFILYIIGLQWRLPGLLLVFSPVGSSWRRLSNGANIIKNGSMSKSSGIFFVLPVSTQAGWILLPGPKFWPRLGKNGNSWVVKRCVKKKHKRF